MGGDIVNRKVANDRAIIGVAPKILKCMGSEWRQQRNVNRLHVRGLSIVCLPGSKEIQ
jgi:hypothetical protein